MFGVSTVDLSAYAVDPYAHDRWCLYIANSEQTVSDYPTVTDESFLRQNGYRIIDFARYKIFDKQADTRVAYQSNVDHSDQNFVDFIFKASFVQFSYNMMYDARSKIIIQSYRSKDLDTFWHRAINDVALPIMNCEAGSAFIRDDRTHLLKLRGTSGLIFLSKENRGKSDTPRLKRDVYYLPDEQSWVARSLRGRQSIYEFDDFKPLRIGRFAERVASDIWSRAYVPMLIRAHDALDSPDFAAYDTHDRNDYPAGVLRLVNPRFPSGGRRHFSWHDKFIIDFIVDVNTVLTRRYLELSKAHDDIEQVCHALGSEIATITRNAEFVKDNIFGSDEFAPICDPARIELAPTLRNMSIALSDIKLYVDDIYFQFEKVRKLALDDELKDKSTDRLFSDVFMKLVNSADAYARIYGRHKVAINNLKDEKLDKLPKVIGTAAAWLSVFRNLLENSVKYAQDGVDPDINITWDDRNRDFVVVNFVDNGPGIPDEERERIFLDGVRGRLALESGQKGTGIGLAYCREVASKCGGRVELGAQTSGARFRVFMRRS